jgi:D-lactate dehydrogenase (cytochrome)
VKKFNFLTSNDIQVFQSMVAADRFSVGESVLDLHSKDQSRHNPRRPEAVIWPINGSEVVQIVRHANDCLIPITAWGSGSSLEGNPIPARGGLVLDFSKMNRIIDIREEDFQADLEPGVIYQDLNERLRHKGLFFPPDPGARATLGGMIANNASGTRTVRYGSTKDYILRLSIVLANGEAIDIGTRAAKTSSGYDLIHLFVGSEGTLGIVIQATVKLIGLPTEFSAAIGTFASVEAAGKAVFEIIRSGLNPAALELMGPECIGIMNREKDLELSISPTLFMEYHGPTRSYLAEVLEIAQGICEEQGCIDFRPGLGRDERDHLLEARHQLAEMIVRNHPDRDSITLDVAVPIAAYPEMISLAQEEKERRDLPAYIFSHAGDGNLHLKLMGRRGDEMEWAVIGQMNQRIVLKALALGGTATGEHGVGLGKKQFMEKEHGKGLEWMRRIKSLFDPNGIFNPDKIFP